MNKSSLFKPLRLWLISAGYALWCTLGDSFQQSASTLWLTQNLSAAALRIFCRLTGCFILLRVLVYLLEKPPRYSRKYVCNLRLLFSVLMLACWIPYIITVWPGTVSNDSVGQLSMALGLRELSADHPLFQTGILWLFGNIGLKLNHIDIGIAAYCVLQTLIAIHLLSSVCAYVWLNVPRPAAVAVLLYHLLNPVLPCFAMCVGKDTSFALAVTWLMLLLFLRISGKSRCSLRICLAAVLCVLLRNAGIAVCAIVLPLLIITELRSLRKGKNSVFGFPVAPSAAIVLSLAVWLFVNMLVAPSLKIPAQKISENYSLPLQQVARVAATEGLTQEERVLISGVIDPDLLADAYNPELSDPVKDLWNQSASEDDVKNFFTGWRKVILRCPMTALSAAFHQFYGYLYPGYLHPTKPGILLGNQYGTQPMLEGKYCFSINSLAENLKTRLNTLLSDHKAARVLLAPGLYGWIAVIAFVLCFRRGQKPLWLAVLPALLTLLGDMLSPVNGYFRYAMPLYMSVGASVLCCAVSLRKTNSSEKTDSHLSQCCTNEVVS